MLTPESLLYPATDTKEHSCTPKERANSRRYIIEIGVASVVYTLALLTSLAYVDRLTGVDKVVVSLVPMLGVAGMTIAFLRFVRRVDEMIRQMIVLAGSVAAVCTAIVTMALGFLENAGVPHVSMTLVWPIMAAFFGIALPLVRRRYR